MGLSKSNLDFFSPLEPRLLLSSQSVAGEDLVANAGGWNSATAILLQDTGMANRGAYYSSITATGDADLFKFTADQTGPMVIQQLSQTNSRLLANLTIYDANRRPLGADERMISRASVQFNAVEGQTYYILAAGSSTSTGEYRIVAKTSSTTPAIGAGVSQDDVANASQWDRARRLTPVDTGASLSLNYSSLINNSSDTDLYAFTANAAGTAQIRALSGNGRLQLNLRVYNANHQLVASRLYGSRSALVSVAVQAGQQYYVQIGSANMRTGQYWVTLNLARSQGEVTPTLSPAPQPTDPVITPAAINFSNAILTITGTSGDDVMTITQTGSTITVINAGRSSTYDSVSRIVANLGDGNDTFTMASNVAVAAKVSGGRGNDVISGGAGSDYLDGGAGNDQLYGQGGSDQLFGGAGANLLDGGLGDDTIVSISNSRDTVFGRDGLDLIWADSTDTVSGLSQTEISGGYIHTVRSFYQPWTTTTTLADYVSLDLAGQSIKDPAPTSSSYTYQNFASVPLFTNGLDMDDIQQGNVGDCYFLASLASMADVDPMSIRKSIVDLGDGTYAVRFYRNGAATYVRMDADLPTSGGRLVYQDLGADRDLWAALLEKGWAYFRRNVGTYISIESGWMQEVYTAMTGKPSINNYFEGVTSAQAYTNITGLLSTGKAVTLGSYGNADSPIVGGHAYTVVSAQMDLQGIKWITVYNPWGRDYYGNGSNDGNFSDGLVRITADQLVQMFSGLSAIDLV